MSEEHTAADEADRWRRQAAHDLDAARHLIDGGHHATACFLCQKAAEKTVAAFLIAKGAERVWGNALVDLCEDAMALDKSFDVIKSVAMLLDKYYLPTRYPTGLPGGVPAEAYDAIDSARALEISGDVRDFIARKLDPDAPTADV